jgi:hypothetical protein
VSNYDEYLTIPHAPMFYPVTLDKIMAAGAGACLDCGGTGRDRNYSNVRLTCWRCGGVGDEPDLPIYMEDALRDARDELVKRMCA